MRIKSVFPALAFFGGFLWDAVTLGRSIQPGKLFLLLGYLIAAAGILVWMGRRGFMRPSGGPTGAPSAPSPSPSSYPGSFREQCFAWMRADGPIFALQFLFGSLFSALVIFYFLSSSYLPGFFLVLALAALLVLNEFLDRHYHRFTLTWTLFGICAILFFNFALPHLFHSIHPAWFFLSTAAGVALVFALKAVSNKHKARGSFWPTLAVACALVLLYLGNAIPPVPLVKKNLVICRNLEHTQGEYRAEMQRVPFYFFWRNSESVVRQRNGEKVFCFTSIFLPDGIQCTLYHKWMYYDAHKKEWGEASRIGFPISGGRKDGFRGYTYKRNLSPGRWQVRVETESGRVLGIVHFRAEISADSSAADSAALGFKKLRLE